MCALPTLSSTVGVMSGLPISNHVASYRVRLDSRRRPTLPAALLEEAEIGDGEVELVARVDGPGRVVLEDPLAQLRDLQTSVAAEMERNHDTADLAMERIEERRLDTSLQ